MRGACPSPIPVQSWAEVLLKAPEGKGLGGVTACITAPDNCKLTVCEAGDDGRAKDEDEEDALDAGHAGLS